MSLGFILTYGVLVTGINRNLTKKSPNQKNGKIITRKSFILCHF